MQYYILTFASLCDALQTHCSSCICMVYRCMCFLVVQLGSISWQKMDYLLTALIDFLTALLEYINLLLYKSRGISSIQEGKAQKYDKHVPVQAYSWLFHWCFIGKRDKCMAQELRSSKLVNTYWCIEWFHNFSCLIYI